MHVRAQIEDRQSTNAVQGSSASIGDQQKSLLAAILGELLNSAMLTVTTASIGNAISECTDRCSIHQLTSYLPPPPILYEQSRLQLCMVPGALGLTTCLADYYEQLSFMRDHMKRPAYAP